MSIRYDDIFLTGAAPSTYNNTGIDFYALRIKISAERWYVQLRYVETVDRLVKHTGYIL